VARLRADLAACTAKSSDLAAQLVSAQSEKAEAEARMASAMVAEAAATVSAALSHAAAPAPLAAMAAPVAPPAVAQAAGGVAKPQSLTAARGGKPDDLKLIKGIGPKLEILCNRLGFYHFDQIAAWTAAEIAWVDDNLEGFKGRVSRDNWVGQARALASSS
jgi:NADH-quinone oxidoreductase subunit E